MQTVRTLSVTTAAASQDLTVLKTVKRDLGITGKADDAFLRDAIRRASGAIAQYCGRVFARETVEETVRGLRADNLRLRRWPVDSVASVVEDSITLAATDYVADVNAGILYRLSSDLPTRWCADKLIVTYTAGYRLLSELPDGIEDACLRLVRMAWFARDRDPLIKREDVAGVGEQELWVGGFGDGAAIPPDVASLIDPYRDSTL